uniref:TIL domain-containing protein n=1 Tax=Setaria digitata TaxID=48799 RepID=A0A915PXJ0_9BILA
MVSEISAFRLLITACIIFGDYAILPLAYSQITVLPKNEMRVELNQTTVIPKTTVFLNNHQADTVALKQNDTAEKSCSGNEMWTNCTGCELKCGQDDLKSCQNVCFKPGCECPAFLGFRRAPNGTCIPKEECPVLNLQCSVLEEFNECGSSCEETCDNFIGPMICSQECVEGCFCKQGFIRETKNGCCILPELCRFKKRSNFCGPNQEYRECGTACPKTCNGIPEDCTQRCVAGCFCKDGYVLDIDRCIPESDCQAFNKIAALKVCGENEVYRKCGNPCREICGEREATECSGCIEGCFCKLGYVLEEKSGACVKPEDCLPPKYVKCPANESFTYCGGCEGTCQKQFINCPAECGSPRCECLAKDNYVRDKSGICIHITECDKQ